MSGRLLCQQEAAFFTCYVLSLLRGASQAGQNWGHWPQCPCAGQRELGDLSDAREHQAQRVSPDW